MRLGGGTVVLAHMRPSFKPQHCDTPAPCFQVVNHHVPQLQSRLQISQPSLPELRNSLQTGSSVKARSGEYSFKQQKQETLGPRERPVLDLSPCSALLTRWLSITKRPSLSFLINKMGP